jgi:hypothetical protein
VVILSKEVVAQMGKDIGNVVLKTLKGTAKITYNYTPKILFYLGTGFVKEQLGDFIIPTIARIDKEKGLSTILGIKMPEANTNLEGFSEFFGGAAGMTVSAMSLLALATHYIPYESTPPWNAAAIYAATKIGTNTISGSYEIMRKWYLSAKKRVEA